MWTLNMETRTASCQNVGSKQVRPMQAALDIHSMAEEIVQLIIDHREDERLKWNKDVSVHIQIGIIQPEGSAVRQSLTGRRKRFRQAVDDVLGKAGWQKVRTNVYAPILGQSSADTAVKLR